jgi:hypothetical protein
LKLRASVKRKYTTFLYMFFKREKAWQCSFLYLCPYLKIVIKISLV